MSRWSVTQHISTRYWLAWCPDDFDESPIRLMDRTVRAFMDHSEALAYADRMARTVEVTLPREGRFIYPTPWGIDLADGTGNHISFTDDDVKPLALALLAYHYRNERNKK